ncbi:MAG TPA: TonB-dependent receptor, partial [Planctomycetota bacterium]|nr:TonB-dependent receptor [Planctomycetota bacterium]
HSGVFWDAQDTFLDDVERIEVIRGPGGSLWGSNAINGVVNVITKSAVDTQGGLLNAGGGTEERVFGGTRYGFQAAEDLHVRVWAKYSDRADEASGLDNGTDARDAWSVGRGGFRADWKAGDHDRLIFMGDFYDGQEQVVVTSPSLTAPFSQTINDRLDLRGGDFIFRWEHPFAPTSLLSLQMYYDYAFRMDSQLNFGVHTEDLDLQYRFSPLDGHDVNCGLGYRLCEIESAPNFELQFLPPRRNEDTASAFVQDEITLVKDRLRLILGTKVEHNEFSGFEYQPSGRLAWNIDERQMAWVAASRAVRTPSILDVDTRLNALVIPGAPPTVVSVFGDRDFQSEVLLAYEAGYRVRPVDPLSLDLALFYNRYLRLRSIEPGAPFLEASPPPAHLVVPFNIDNDFKGQSGGAELASNLQAASWWLIQANYSYLRVDLVPTNGSLDTGTKNAAKENPRHQVWVRSAMDLPMNVTLDVIGRYVSDLSAFPVKEYVEADVRLAWRDATRRFEAALVGQNLVHDAHAEYGSPAMRSEIRRGGYASLTWRF